MSRDSATLGTDEVRVWFARPEGPLGDGPVASSSLDAVERAKHDAFVFPRDRRIYLAAHQLLRRALSACAPVPPAAWRFSRGPQGRPEIAGAVSFGLRFNLSHTRGLVACAVCRVRDVGVDVEELRPLSDLIDLARHSFSTEEFEAVEGSPPDQQRALFYQLWTLKESYIKARGLGLTLALNGFGFEVDPDRETPSAPRKFWTRPELGDPAEGWRFRQWAPTREHRAALCVRGPAPLDLRIAWEGDNPHEEPNGAFQVKL